MSEVGRVQRAQLALELGEVLPLLQDLEEIPSVDRSALLTPSHGAQHPVTLEQLLHIGDSLVKMFRMPRKHGRDDSRQVCRLAVGNQRRRLLARGRCQLAAASIGDGTIVFDSRHPAESDASGRPPIGRRVTAPTRDQRRRGRYHHDPGHQQPTRHDLPTGEVRIGRACDLAGELLKPVALPEVFGESVTTVSRQKGKHRIVLIAISARGLHILDQIHQRLSIVNLAQDFLSTPETLERSSRLHTVWQELDEVPQLLGVHPDLVRAVRKIDAGCPFDRVPQMGCLFDEMLPEDPAAGIAA
jgi:hypothetical protein